MKAATWSAAWALRLMFRLFPGVPKALTFAGAAIRPEPLAVATRHGVLRCHVYRPDPADHDAAPPPAHLNFHGGAFIVRAPLQDAHACRFIAATTGAVVVNVDYDTAPTVGYPVAEEQAMDVLRWLRRNAATLAIDAGRITVGGFSAGAKLAVNVCQQCRDSGEPMPTALVACYPALNMTTPPSARPSGGAGRPPTAVAPWLVALMYDAYFEDPARRAEALASPELDRRLASFPPTLVLTAEHDAVAPEAVRFAAALARSGVDVRHRQLAGCDHGMTHNLPADSARFALDLVAEHLTQVMARPAAQHRSRRQEHAA